MNSLVPIETSVTPTASTMPYAPSYNLSQTLPANAVSATFDLTGFSFSVPPSNVIPSVVRSTGTESGIVAYPRQATTTSFTCDLSSPTPDGTFVCSIQIFP